MDHFPFKNNMWWGMIMVLKRTEMQIINKNKRAHSVPPLLILFYTSSRGEGWRYAVSLFPKTPNITLWYWLVNKNSLDPNSQRVQSVKSDLSVVKIQELYLVISSISVLHIVLVSDQPLRYYTGVGVFSSSNVVWKSIDPVDNYYFLVRCICAKWG